jgi:hypothetical protein
VDLAGGQQARLGVPPHPHQLLVERMARDEVVVDLQSLA